MVKFWSDPSVGLGDLLKDKFPRLYALETDKEIAFKDRWSYSNGNWHGSWDWRTPLRGRSLDEFQELLTFLSGASFKPQGSDFWKWSWDKKGMFSVKKMASIIQGTLSQGVAAGANFHWNSLVPSKVNIFVWRA